jgi:glutamine---fructose-6-phosphate transaminase (isomerizing)
MCGIIAGISENVVDLLLDGLQQLQNRGYDSAGICTFENDFVIDKFASNNESALCKLDHIKANHLNTNVGIAHTRWATHGPKTDINSHPHKSFFGNFVLVHNGIIENFAEIKQLLQENNVQFASETDTEVIVNLIEYYYQVNKNVIESIEKTVNKLEGTWGLVVMYKNEPTKLYCTRKGSPLLISKTDHIAIIASEQSAFCNKTTNYIALENHDICSLSIDSNGIHMHTNKVYIPLPIKTRKIDLTPHPYKFWTEKEIYEQVDSSLRSISLGGRLLSNYEVKLNGLTEQQEQLQFVENLILLGCGTSYFAGMCGQKYFKELCNFNTIQLIDGAEFELNDIPNKGKTAIVLLSQSGETKDLYRCVELCKEQDVITIGVVNVVDSLIAREVDCGCYLNAGREVGVASTKSFTSQVIILSMMAIWFAQIHDLNVNKRKKVIRDLRKLYLDIEDTLHKNKDPVDLITHLFENKESCFILGKHKGEAIAHESALKIKEISYIHAEGYNSSSLKHGPFALLEKDYPVILIAPKNKHYSKNMNAFEEIKTRHANVIVVTDDTKIKSKYTLFVSQNDSFSDLLCIIPMQLLAFKLSLKRGCNVDMPRNLAKVVTVE